MSFRIGINGYGRIGQCILRALYENNYRKDMQIVAINELSDLETLAYLTRYDTTHGRFPNPVTTRKDALLVADDPIRFFNEKDPAQLNWEEMRLDLLLECSGSFKERHIAEQYLTCSVPRMLLSQPAHSDVDATVVYGINETALRPDHRIVSAASCTTNCIVPVLKILNDALGIEYGTITTIHSAMNDQPVIDAYHKSDLRLTRSALQSIIPVDTGLAKGIDRLLPEFRGCFKCSSVRVPTINVSCMDLCVHVHKKTTENEVNRILRQATEGPLSGILGFTQEPHASVDFNHDPRSSIVDTTQTRVASNKLVKLLCWFDNEWGFSNRMLGTSRYWLNIACR